MIISLIRMKRVRILGCGRLIEDFLPVNAVHRGAEDVRKSAHLRLFVTAPSGEAGLGNPNFRVQPKLTKQFLYFPDFLFPSAPSEFRAAWKPVHADRIDVGQYTALMHQIEPLRTRLPQT